MNSRRGFTLIELLAVILLISLLLGVAMPTIMRYMKKGTIAYYNNLESEIKIAGADYVETYRSLLPQKVGHVRVIELSELVSNKYIDPVVDEKGNECTGEATVKKISRDNYEYYSCLKCGEYYQSKEEDCSFSEYDNVYADSGDYEIRVPKDYYEVEQTKSFISPLASVYYKGELIKDDLEGKPKKVDTNVIGTEEVVYYYHGVTKRIEVNVLDKGEPGTTQVIMKYANKNGKSYKGEWYSGNVYVSYKATDYASEGITGSGISYYEVSNDGKNFIKLSADDATKYKPLSSNEQLISAEGNYIRYVRAVDKSGNKGPVTSYRIKIDKTAPTCNLEVTSGTKFGDWYNTEVTIGFKSTTETVSSVIAKGIDTTAIKSPVKAKVVTGSVTDSAGNVSTCKITINMDNKKPNNPTIKASDGILTDNWHNSDFSLNYSGANNISGNLYYYKIDAANTVTSGRADGTNATSTNITIETNKSVYHVLVCSTAGLCSDNVNYIVKFDKTPPTCIYSGESTTWRTSYVELRVKCDDNNQSGCSPNTPDYFFGVEYSVKELETNISFYDNAGNKTKCKDKLNVYLDIYHPIVSSYNITLGTEDYHFADNQKNNISVASGSEEGFVSGYTLTCNPANSLKTGIYNVTCTATAGNGLSGSTTFEVRHSYPATYVSKTCEGDYSCNCGNKPYCPCGYGPCNPWGCPDWESPCVKEHGGADPACGCTQTMGGSCCGGEPPACNETMEWQCEKCPAKDCSYYDCPDGGTLNGTLCVY